MMHRSQIITVFAFLGASLTLGFQIAPAGTRTTSSPATTSSLFAATIKKKGYDPKWKKKETLADKSGKTDFKDIGLVGTIPVVFKQGNATRTTMAIVGQPLRDVATQAGQFIKYGCGIGECGTCECMMDGKWVRPCSTNVPPLAQGQELVVTVKGIKNKAVSSGKFYSFRSFFMGFWNNLIGMFGMVRFRRAAKKNWAERQEYENSIAARTAEKKRLKALGAATP